MTPGLLDPLKLKWAVVKAQIAPYIWAIKIGLRVALATIIFIGGCNYQKGKSEAKVAELASKLKAVQGDNADMKKALSEVARQSELYRRQSEEQAKAAAKAQDEMKRAEKRAQAESEALEKKLKDAYAKNRAWADSAIPAEYRRLLNDKGQD